MRRAIKGLPLFGEGWTLLQASKPAHCGNTCNKNVIRCIDLVGHCACSPQALWQPLQKRLWGATSWGEYRGGLRGGITTNGHRHIAFGVHTFAARSRCRCWNFSSKFNVREDLLGVGLLRLISSLQLRLISGLQLRGLIIHLLQR